MNVLTVFAYSNLRGRRCTAARARAAAKCLGSRWTADEQGEADAQCVLANLYVRGAGVPQDYVQAHKWFNLAAARSPDPDIRIRAAEARDTVAKAMSPWQVAEAQRLARDWRPRLD